MVLTQKHGKNLSEIVKKYHNDKKYSTFLLFIIRMLKKIVRGIRSVHGRGVVHRDLKFLNFVFEFRTYTLKIIDFGSSTTINPGDGLIENRAVTRKAKKRFEKDDEIDF